MTFSQNREMEFERRITRNETNIVHIQDGVKEVKERLESIEQDAIEIKETIAKNHQEIIQRLDASRNQWAGASKLAKFLQTYMPYVCSIVAYFVGRLHV